MNSNSNAKLWSRQSGTGRGGWGKHADVLKSDFFINAQHSHIQAGSHSPRPRPRPGAGPGPVLPWCSFSFSSWRVYFLFSNYMKNS